MSATNTVLEKIRADFRARRQAEKKMQPTTSPPPTSVLSQLSNQAAAPPPPTPIPRPSRPLPTERPAATIGRHKSRPRSCTVLVHRWEEGIPVRIYADQRPVTPGRDIPELSQDPRHLSNSTPVDLEVLVWGGHHSTVATRERRATPTPTPPPSAGTQRGGQDGPIIRKKGAGCRARQRTQRGPPGRRDNGMETTRTQGHEGPSTGASDRSRV